MTAEEGIFITPAVKSEYRREGIGKALVIAVMDALKKEKINKVALVVFCTNELGNNFWESIGFNKRDDLIYRNISLNDNNK